MISSGLRIAAVGYPLGRGRFTLATGVPKNPHVPVSLKPNCTVAAP